MAIEGTSPKIRTSRIKILPGPFGRTRREIEESARDEGLWPLTETHWKIIQFVRAYYRDSGQTPAAVRIGRAVGLSPRQLNEMFPHGAVKTVLRMAGLNRPIDSAETCPYFMLFNPAVTGEN